MIRRPSVRPGTNLASSPSGGEDDSLFSPPKRGKIRPFLGRLSSFRPFMHAGGCMQKKKKKRGSTQKTPMISKKLPPTASDTVKSPCDHNVVYFWDRFCQPRPLIVGCLSHKSFSEHLYQTKTVRANGMVVLPCTVDFRFTKLFPSHNFKMISRPQKPAGS